MWDGSRKHTDSKDMLARYRRAQTLLKGTFTNEVVRNATIFPVYVGDTNCFWYTRQLPDRREWRLVNPDFRSNEPAFDHDALAAALAEAAAAEVHGDSLPLTDVEIDLDPPTVTFDAFDKRWCFDPRSRTCEQLQTVAADEVAAPNGSYVAFARGHNIWLRDVRSGEERALTTDGEELNVYGAVSTGWAVPNPDVPPDLLPRGLRALWAGLQVRWSPDSKRLFVVQRDTRRVKTLPVVHHIPEEGVRPTVSHVRVAYPGDVGIEEIRLLSIDVETGAIVDTDYGQIPTTRNGFGFFSSGLGWWGTDSRTCWFIHVDRWYKYARLVEFNTDDGACRIVFEEKTDTHINLMLNQDTVPSFLPLPETDEILWLSERTGWAHLYLYDLKTGTLKNAVTSGPGLVRNIVGYIPQRREVFVQMAGRQEGCDPYYRDLVRVNIDTGESATLASSDHEHVILSKPRDVSGMMFEVVMGCPAAAQGVSATGDFAVVTRSRADELPVTYVIDRDGEKVMDVEAADVSGLPQGWCWPEPVALKAADGLTDIYGLVFRPSNFDPNASYPVISEGFNQPEIAWVSKGSFTNGAMAGFSYWAAAALAELGFIVVQIDGRGGPEREKAFFDESYGSFESASNIDDHVAGIRQLAERYPQMDLNRVGIAALGGGSGAVQGMLKHPDFFKVGVVRMHHDGRLMAGQMQGEKYDGPEARHVYPENYVERLEGKLLLMNGMLDTTCPPAATFRLVDALHKANKDFDMIMLPCFGHGSGSGGAYLTRRSWDYFVRHLMGVEPPKAFQLDP